MTSVLRGSLVATSLFLAACSSSTDVTKPTSSETTTMEAAATSTTVGPDLTTDQLVVRTVEPIVIGAQRLIDDDLVLLRNRRIGLIANAASVVGDDHVADLMFAHPDVELAALFAPEHGLRGTVDAGEIVEDTIDESTGVTVFSLYGQERAPTPEMLEGIEVLVYDLQDVGARYFTYISTMGLAMQSAAAADIPFVVLDRPNPLGGDVGGFVRDADVDSFIAQYPIADTYGLTAGELATAIVGEGWLPGLETLDLRVIEMEGWTGDKRWSDTDLRWVAPSPSLQTRNATLLYPALVFFEATTVSVGRGTSLPFEVFGAPWLDGDAATDALNELELPGVSFEPIGFIPQGDGVLHAGRPIDGVLVKVTDPALVNPTDLGVHLMRTASLQRVPGRMIDSPDLLDLLAGGPTLRTELDDGMSADEIIAQREDERLAFEELIDPYRLYPNDN